MPLHLAQHKSYHPYNQQNRERVRRDQAQAAQQEEQRRQTSFADRDQARIAALRAGRNGPQTSSSPHEAARVPPSTSRTATTKTTKDTSQGHALLRPEDELTPWYTTSQLRNGADARKTDDQRLEDAYKETSIKSSNDPLKAMQTYLAQRKAVKTLPPAQAPSPSSRHIADNLSDRYEPEALKAAHSSRRRSSGDRHRSSTRSRSNKNQDDVDRERRYRCRHDTRDDVTSSKRHR